MLAARIERNNDEAHCIERYTQKKSSAIVSTYITGLQVPKPEPRVPEQSGAEKYNPYEAYKAYVEFGPGGVGAGPSSVEGEWRLLNFFCCMQ
jgi:hypothetical protein